MIKSKIKYIFICIILVLVAVYGIIYTSDLEQNNKETIFLTKNGINSYKKFLKTYGDKNFVILKKEYNQNITNKDIDILESKKEQLLEICDEECSIISPNDLPDNFKKFINLKSENHLGLIIIANKDFINLLLDKIEEDQYWGKTGADLHLVGVPYTNRLLNSYSKSIKKVLFPSLFIGILLLLIILFKNIKVGIILFIPCLISASISLSTTKYLFEESNLVTSIIPLLMFVINLSLTLHIYFTAIEFKNLSRAVKEKMWPTILMIITTFIGFFSLYFSELKAISIFGVMSAGLIVITAITTLLWLISINKVFNIFANENKSIQASNFQQYFKYFLKLRYLVIIFIVSIIFGSIFYKKIPILTDATQYFPKSSGIKESIENVSTTVVGPPILDVLIDFNEQIKIKDLQKLQIIEQEIRNEIIEVDKNIKIISSNLLVQKANKIYSGKNIIPEFIIAYKTLLSKSLSAVSSGFPIESTYRINILSAPMNVKKYEIIVKKVSKILVKNDLAFHYNGLYYQLMIAQKKMITTLFKSFLISLLIISLIAVLAFKKLKVFFIFIFVNIIPVFLSFIFLKIFGISFNIATVMTYSISLGLIVDSSFHIIHTLNKKSLTHQYFYSTIILPVLTSSLILSFCFLLFSLNDFLPIREFGICLSIIILIGMYFDLKILPRLYLNKDSI